MGYWVGCGQVGCLVGYGVGKGVGYRVGYAVGGGPADGGDGGEFSFVQVIKTLSINISVHPVVPPRFICLKSETKVGGKVCCRNIVLEAATLDVHGVSPSGNCPQSIDITI